MIGHRRLPKESKALHTRKLLHALINAGRNAELLAVLLKMIGTERSRNFERVERARKARPVRQQHPHPNCQQLNLWRPYYEMCPSAEADAFGETAVASVHPQNGSAHALCPQLID